MTDETVFVDSSFFKALIDPKDEFNSKALRVWKGLAKEVVYLGTSNYILDESFTLIRVKCGYKKLLEFREFLKEENLKIFRVTVSDEANAWRWFLEDWSNLSFTDCVSFALMKRLKIKKVATFDNHFSRAGLKITV